MTIVKTRTINNVRLEGHVRSQNQTQACRAKSGCVEIGIVEKKDEVVVVVCRHIGNDDGLAVTGGGVKRSEEFSNIA